MRASATQNSLFWLFTIKKKSKACGEPFIKFSACIPSDELIAKPKISLFSYCLPALLPRSAPRTICNLARSHLRWKFGSKICYSSIFTKRLVWGICFLTLQRKIFHLWRGKEANVGFWVILEWTWMPFSCNTSPTTLAFSSIPQTSPLESERSRCATSLENGCKI